MAIIDIPTKIMRNEKLTATQKAFLLWCWCNRAKDSDMRYNLYSKREYCNVRHRDLMWYNYFLNLYDHRRSMMRGLVAKLKKLGIWKVECENTRNECTYIDFEAC